MTRSNVRVVAILAALLVWIGFSSPHATAQPALFTPLGFVPGSQWTQANSVSAGGGVVVGRAIGTPTARPFRWTPATGMQLLTSPPNADETNALGVSADGAVIIGEALSSGTLSVAAVRWMGGGVELLPSLVDPSDNAAYGISADGQVIVGSSGHAGGVEAMRWTLAGAQAIGDLPGGDVSATAYAASADGSVVVGTGTVESGTEAFRWTAAGGIQGLGAPSDGYSSTEALGVNADGSVVVGWGRRAPGAATFPIEAFRWTESVGMQGLGTLPGATTSAAFGVSGDGNTVVGESPFLAVAPRAFIWTSASGMVDLKSFLIDHGAVGLDGWTLERATALSLDGTRIVGYGQNPAGLDEAWLATVPEPESFALLFAAAFALLLGRCRAPLIWLYTAKHRKLLSHQIAELAE